MDVLGYYNIPEQGSWGWNYYGQSYRAWQEQARQDEMKFKALTTASGIVQQGATGGQSLRVQYLHDVLENVSFDQNKCVLMKLMPKGKAFSNTVEYTVDLYPGSGGDGFIDETGSDGAFGVGYSDDNFVRQVELVKYMATGRQITLPEQEVRNLADPMQIEYDHCVRDLLSKAELAGFFGNAGLNTSSWNGLEAQITTWAQAYSFDQDILYDAGGQPLDKYLLEDASIVVRNKYGDGDLLIQSSTGWGDSNKLLFPEARDGEGTGNRRYGTFKDTFDGPNGPVRIANAPMLRPGRPLRPDGPGSDGRPRLTVTGSGLYGPDPNALSFAANPFVAASGGNGCQAVTPGSGPFMQNGNVNTDSGILSTLPALPSGGTNANRLAAGTYYFGVSVVYRGAEGPMYIFGAGAQSASTISGTPTAITCTAGQAIQLDFDNTTPAVTGLGSTYGRANVYYRIYRYGGPGAAAPTSVTQFQFLDNVGIPTAGNSRYVDNGYRIPYTDTAFLISTTNNGKKGWEMLQLLPLMRRMGLPELPMASPLVLLWFATPMLWQRRRNIVIRNIGRAN